jgi:hypothetical protein
MHLPSFGAEPVLALAVIRSGASARSCRHSERSHCLLLPSFRAKRGISSHPAIRYGAMGMVVFGEIPRSARNDGREGVMALLGMTAGMALWLRSE